MMRLPLQAASSAQDAVARVRAYVLAHPDVARNASRWIEGMGWDHTRWLGASFPAAADLEADAVLRGRRVSLSRVDGHAKWVSRAVLDMMGELPTEVEGGVIVRDEWGEATGACSIGSARLILDPGTVA